MMGEIERWWRVTRSSDGHVTWTDEDPSDRLVAAWEDADVTGPYVLEAEQPAGVLDEALAVLTDPERPDRAARNRAVAIIEAHSDATDDPTPRVTRRRGS